MGWRGGSRGREGRREGGREGGQEMGGREREREEEEGKKQREGGKERGRKRVDVLEDQGYRLLSPLFENSCNVATGIEVSAELWHQWATLRQTLPVGG